MATSYCMSLTMGCMSYLEIVVCLMFCAIFSRWSTLSFCFQFVLMVLCRMLCWHISLYKCSWMFYKQIPFIQRAWLQEMFFLKSKEVFRVCTYFETLLLLGRGSLAVFVDVCVYIYTYIHIYVYRYRYIDINIYIGLQLY